MKASSQIKLSVNSCSYSSWDEKFKILLATVFISSILFGILFYKHIVHLYVLRFDLLFQFPETPYAAYTP